MNIVFRRRPSEVAPVNGSCGPSAALATPWAGLFNDPFFGEALTRGPLGVFAGEQNPMPLDVSETDAAYIVHADVPGFTREQISLEIEKGVLTIRAQAAQEKQDEGTTFHRRERRTRSVARQIALPEGVQEDGVSADLADGVLAVTLPKAPQAQPRKIAIR
jgi:HSP20 family protein